MSDLRYAKPGDKPIRSASAFNAMLDAARANQRQDFGNELKPAPRTLPQDQNTQILVRNDTGHTFNRYDSVGLDEPIWLPQDGSSETEQHLNDPVYSISRLNHCRHRGRWAVLTAPLPPCGIVRAVMSGGTNAWIPEVTFSVNTPVAVDASVYQDGSLSVMSGSGQVLWSGDSTMPTCSGTVDLECRGDGNKWLVIADNCSEGCSPFACGDEDLNPDNLPCTPFDRIYNHECCPSQLALLRISNATSTLRTNCHECFDANCKYECIERHGEWVYQQVRDCLGEEVVPTTTGLDPSTTAAPLDPSTTAGAPTTLDPSTTASPSTTAEPPRRCQCPDLNALVIDDPVRYPPCGPEQCPPQLLVACDTTTPEPTTLPPSTTVPPTTLPPTTLPPSTPPPTTLPPSTTQAPTTSGPSTTPEPTTTPEPCALTCQVSCSSDGSPTCDPVSSDTAACNSDIAGCSCNFLDPNIVAYCNSFGDECVGFPGIFNIACTHPGDHPLPPTTLPPSTTPPTTSGTDPSTTLPPTTSGADPSTTLAPPTTTGTDPSTTLAPTTLDPSTTAAPTTFPPTTPGPCDTAFGCRYECRDIVPPTGIYMWVLFNDNCGEHPDCSCDPVAPGAVGPCSADNNLALTEWLPCDQFDI